MNTERDLLYGVLALQADLINTEQFVDACTAWSAQRNGSLESLLLEWGYLSPTDHRSLEYLMHRRLAKNAGDVHTCLATISDDRSRQIPTRDSRPTPRPLRWCANWFACRFSSA